MTMPEHAPNSALAHCGALFCLIGLPQLHVRGLQCSGSPSSAGETPYVVAVGRAPPSNLGIRGACGSSRAKWSAFPLGRKTNSVAASSAVLRHSLKTSSPMPAASNGATEGSTPLFSRFQKAPLDPARLTHDPDLPFCDISEALLSPLSPAATRTPCVIVSCWTQRGTNLFEKMCPSPLEHACLRLPVELEHSFCAVLRHLWGDSPSCRKRVGPPRPAATFPTAPQNCLLPGEPSHASTNAWHSLQRRGARDQWDSGSPMEPLVSCAREHFGPCKSTW